MGRISRSDILYDGCYAHVFTRTIEKRKICKDRKNFVKLRNLLFEIKKKYSFEIYHYCLMGTHFHMAVRINNVEAFSKGLGYMKKEYSRWYNAQGAQINSTLCA